MNGKDLLIALGDIDQKYYDEGENAAIDTSKGYKPLRKPLMIAAIIGLMLFLMGCAWVVLRMQDLQIGEHIITQTNETGETELPLAVLSLQGIEDTPNYLANQEWLLFTQSYTPKLDVSWESGEEYWAYSLQDQTMVDKLDAICKKYGLKVIGKPWHEHVDCSKFLTLAGVESLLKTNSDAVLQMPAGRFFPGGSFTIYGRLTLPGMEEQLDITYHCVAKDVFYDVFAYVDPDTVTQRNYTTKEGITLLLLESGQSGMILVDREAFFLTLGITLGESASLEEIAEQFDFTIQPNAIDSAAADAREQASLEEIAAKTSEKDRFVRETYGEYVEDLLWSDRQKLVNGFDAAEIPQKEYAFCDLDGNGQQELLIVSNGMIVSVVAMENGKTNEGKSYNMVLCEGNVLIDRMDLGDGTWYHIFRFANNGEAVFSNAKEQSIVRLKKENGVWWRTSSTDHYAEFDTQITEAEAMEILNAYPAAALDTRPLEQFVEPQG